MKKILNKKSYISVLLVILIVVLIVANVIVVKRLYVNALTVNDLIDSIIECKESDDPMVGFMSNPYEYIKDNDQYDVLVSRGTGVLDDLYEYIEDSETDGLKEYIAAAAIEDILGTELKETEMYGWDTGKTFIESIDAVIDDRKDIVNDIMVNNDSKKQMDNYGMLVDYTLGELGKDDGNDLKQIKGLQKISSKQKKDIKQFISLSDKR